MTNECPFPLKFLPSLCGASAREPNMTSVSPRAFSVQSRSDRHNLSALPTAVSLPYLEMPSIGPVSAKELAAAASITALGIYLVNRLTQPSKLPLPPGPKSLPVVGHLFSMPRSDEPAAYANMSKELNSWAHAYAVRSITADYVI